MSLQCNADWDFKLHSWPHVPDGSGSVDISVSGTTASLGVLVTAVALHPQLKATAVSLAVGSIDLTFHGSLLDWLLNLFKGYIEDQVRSGLTGAFAAAIASVVAKQINPALAAMPMAFPVPARPPYDCTEVRFGLTDDPTFTSGYLAVDLQGDVVAAADQRDPPIAPPALPPWTAASAGYAVQLQLSQYTPESAVYAYYAAGLLAWAVPPGDLPFGLNRTAGYGPIAPGFPAAFPGAAVSLNVSFAALPAIAFTPSGINISAPLVVTFVAEANGSSAAAFTLLATTGFAGAVTVRAANGTASPAALLARIAYLSSSLSAANSSVGPVRTAALQGLIDAVFADVVVPEVNALFAAGLPLPQIGGVTLVNPAVLYFDGFLTVATNFSFAPPPALDGGAGAGRGGQAGAAAAAAAAPAATGRVDLLRGEDAEEVEAASGGTPARRPPRVDLLSNDGGSGGGSESRDGAAWAPDQARFVDLLGDGE